MGRTTRLYASFLCAILAGICGAQSLTGVRYLDNGQIKLGVDLGKGGAIVYFSQEGGPNMVNDADFGRQIQMSFYSGPVPFAPNGKQPAKAWADLGWNPIQTGDYFGHTSKTIEFESMGIYMHLRCIPMQWPLNNEPGECVFDETIWLDGDAVHVSNRLINNRSDKTQFPARAQELPAIYGNGSWYRLMTYTGPAPFTNGPLNQETKDPPLSTFPGHSFLATENWAALINKGGDGFGIVDPGVEIMGGMFFGVPGVGSEVDGPTGYISPRFTEILDSNIDYSFDYILVAGSLAQIRDYAYAHVARASPPSYSFKADRQHWYYVNASDTGWPIQGELRVKMEGKDPQLISPAGFWHASDATKLEIEAACSVHDANAQVFWSRFDSPGFAEKRSVKFKAIPDGKYHLYTVKLSSSPEYKGVITGLRFDPEPKGAPGDEIRIKSIRLR